MIRRIPVLLTAALTAVGALACADGPVAPEGLGPGLDAETVAAQRPSSLQSSDGSETGNPDPSVLARFRDGPPSILIAWAQRTIGPEGGSLRLLDFEIVVPPGAVDQPTRFKIRLPVDPHGREHVMAEFSPHGQTFAVPVTIRFPLAGTTIDGSADAGVVWWDGSGWIRIGGTVIEDGARLEATTSHFSTYGTSDDDGLIAEMSSGG